MNSIRLLLVEPLFEETVFLQQALEEVQERAAPGDWVSFDVTHVETLDEACLVAAAQPPDAILMNPALEGSTAFGSVAALHSAVPEVALVLIVEQGDEQLARRLLREGAQDFVIRQEIDCLPLCRTLRNAIVRQRFFNASRTGSAFDDLTGLFNEGSFYSAALRDLHLAAGAGQPLTLVLADIDNLADITIAYGREQRDLTLLDAADVLRQASGPGALIGCFSGKRFAVLAWSMRPDELIGRIQTQHAHQPRAFAFSFGYAVTHPGAMESIDPLLAAAQSSLCENGQSYQIPTAPSRSTRPTASAMSSQA